MANQIWDEGQVRVIECIQGTVDQLIIDRIS